jgi:UDP:flavonoid glycosyltransferase YjiC (YdhE family)
MTGQRFHIAMVGIPAISHIRPSFEVIRELVARGHRVTYANDPSVRDLIENGDGYTVTTDRGEYPTKTVLIAAGNDSLWRSVKRSAAENPLQRSSISYRPR